MLMEIFEYIYLDLCLALSSMMRMLSKYVRMYVLAHAHSDVACRRLSEGSQKPGTASSAL